MQNYDMVVTITKLSEVVVESCICSVAYVREPTLPNFYNMVHRTIKT